MGMSAKETVRLLYQLEGWPNAWPEQVNDVCATMERILASAEAFSKTLKSGFDCNATEGRALLERIRQTGDLTGMANWLKSNGVPGLSPGPQVPDVARPFAKSFPAPTRVAVHVVLPPGVP